MSFRWLIWSLASPSQLLLAITMLGTLLVLVTSGRAGPPTRWARVGKTLTVTGGVGLLLFGLLPGLPFALLGITAGAFGAFLAGRALGRTWVEQRMGDNLKLQALDEAVNAQSFYIVFLTRFAIVLPFNVLNYAFGLTRVSAVTYVVATALGMLPAVLLYVYLGTLADDFSAILAGDVRPASGAYWIALVAIVAIAAVLWIVQRAARRALQQQKLD